MRQGPHPRQWCATGLRPARCDPAQAAGAAAAHGCRRQCCAAARACRGGRSMSTHPDIGVDPATGAKPGLEGKPVARDREALAAIRRLQVAGVALVAVFVGGLGGWAATSELAGAVIASGTVIVE